MKSFRSMFMLLSGLASMLLVCHERVSATSYTLTSTWEEKVLRADFVGVVECQLAGGIVASFRVIEAWKGTQVKNDMVSLRHGSFANRPQFPISLCGQKFVVIGYRTSDPARGRSSRYAGRLPDSWVESTEYNDPEGRPLWWRDIPVDYYWSEFVGGRPLNNSQVWFRSSYQDIQTLEEAVMAMVSLSPEKQEELILRSFCEAYFNRYDSNGRSRRVTLPYWMKLAKDRIGEAHSVQEIVRVLVDITRSERQSIVDVGNILSYGGGEITLMVLQQIDPDHWHSLKNRLRSQFHPTEVAEPNERDKLALVNKPTKRELRRLRAALSGGFGLLDSDVLDALEILTSHDPKPVAKYLQSWVCPLPRGGDMGGGYVVGSYFGHRCGSQRKKHLETLTGAKDDTLRVSGAVYLCFEDEALGMSYLEQFMDLEGDPGVWAALNLVRRGGKDAMPRVLRVFDDPLPDLTPSNHRNLQNRLLVLLSNSSKASGIAMPHVAYGHGQGEEWPPEGLKLDGPYQQREARRKNLEWWEANKDRFIPYDPWLEILKSQKID